MRGWSDHCDAGLQDAQRRDEAVHARKKKDAETALLEEKLRQLPQELDEARQPKADKPKEPTPEPVPQDTDNGQDAEQAGAKQPVNEGTDAPQPDPGSQACVWMCVF